jgi:hypothetical protein
LIQGERRMSNIDSRIHCFGFDCFKFFDSIGPLRLFVAVPHNARNGRRNGRSANEAGTAALDPASRGPWPMVGRLHDGFHTPDRFPPI